MGHDLIPREPDGGFMIFLSKSNGVEYSVELVQHAKNGQWSIAGGGYTFGTDATLRDTANREADEESGSIDTEVYGALFLFCVRKNRKRSGQDNVNHFYLSESFKKKPNFVILTDEISKVETFPLKSIVTSFDMNIADGTRRILTLLYYYFCENHRFLEIMREIGCYQISAPFEFRIDEDLPPIPVPTTDRPD